MITNICIDITEQMNNFKKQIKKYALDERMIIMVVQSHMLSLLDKANYKSPLLDYYKPASSAYKQTNESLTCCFNSLPESAETICSMYVNGYREFEIIPIANGYNLKLTLHDDKQETFQYIEVTSTIRAVDEHRKFMRELANEGYVFNDTFLFKCLNYELAREHTNGSSYDNNPLNLIIDDKKIVKFIIDMFYECYKNILFLYQDLTNVSEKWIIGNDERSKTSSSCLQLTHDGGKRQLGAYLVVLETIKLKTFYSTNI